MLTNISLLPRIKFWRSSFAKGEYGFLFLFALLCVPYFINLFRAIETRVGLEFLTDYSDVILRTIGIIVAISWLIKRVHFKDVIVFVSAIVFYYGSTLLYPNTEKLVIENGEYFVWTCLIIYFVGVSVDLSRHRTPFVWMARMALFLMYLYMLFFGMKENENGEIEYMGYAYIFLPWVLILIWEAIDTLKIINIVLAVLAVFMIFSMGTRGPVGCIAVFIVTYILFAKHFKKDLLVKSIIVLSGILVYYFKESIILFFMGISISLGFSTRVYDRIFLEEINDNGRTYIIDYLMRFIESDGSGMGYGLFSDRMLNNSDTYAHNLEVELLCDFGRIGGTIAILLLALLFYRAFKSTWKTDSFVFLLVFFCSSIVMLQVSGSYLSSSVFYLFMGMCVSAIRHNKEAF